jgi:NADPH2:quinone reductase
MSLRGPIEEGFVRAWLMDRFEGVDALRLGEVPDPRPGQSDVVLAIHTSALNPADAFLARGLYPARPSLPHILGRDGTGVVIEVGPGAGRVRVGDVMGILRCRAGVETWGTFAERCVVPAESLAPVPAGWSADEMAAAPLAFLTAWQALTQWSTPPAPPPAGAVVLVTGASGGVGVASVLLARSMRLRIVALSRSEEKAATLRALGADVALDPRDETLRDRVAEAVGPGKVDLVIDSVGGALFPQLVSMLGYRGRISVVGRSGGDVPSFNTGTLFFRRNRIGGVAVGDYSAAEAQVAWQEITRRLDAIGARPVVDHVFAFEDLQSAFARLQSGPMGKVLLRVRS